MMECAQETYKYFASKFRSTLFCKHEPKYHIINNYLKRFSQVRSISYNDYISLNDGEFNYKDEEYDVCTLSHKITLSLCNGLQQNANRVNTTKLIRDFMHNIRIHMQKKYDIKVSKYSNGNKNLSSLLYQIHRLIIKKSLSCNKDVFLIELLSTYRQHCSDNISKLILDTIGYYYFYFCSIQSHVYSHTMCGLTDPQLYVMSENYVALDVLEFSNMKLTSASIPYTPIELCIFNLIMSRTESAFKTFLTCAVKLKLCDVYEPKTFIEQFYYDIWTVDKFHFEIWNNIKMFVPHSWLDNIIDFFNLTDDPDDMYSEEWNNIFIFYANRLKSIQLNVTLNTNTRRQRILTLVQSHNDTEIIQSINKIQSYLNWEKAYQYTKRQLISRRRCTLPIYQVADKDTNNVCDASYLTVSFFAGIFKRYYKPCILKAPIGITTFNQLVMFCFILQLLNDKDKRKSLTALARDAYRAATGNAIVTGTNSSYMC